MTVSILSQLDYHVVAATGKPDASPWLESLGAREVMPRGDLDDASDRPLLPDRWAGAVDTVGGNTLATLVRSVRHPPGHTECSNPAYQP